MGISGGPDIIQDGLILALDAADRNSYVSGSTIWKDLTGSNVTGSLINGPTFVSDNGGSLDFDGTDDYVELNTTNILTGTSAFTIECAFNLEAGNYGELFGNYGSGYTSGYIWFATAGLYINGAVYVPNYATATQGKHVIASTRTSGGSIVTYLDGVSVNTGTLATSIVSNPKFRMGMDTNSAGGTGGEQLNGKIYNLKVYNRALSATEILQNYNALKSRFNL